MSTNPESFQFPGHTTEYVLSPPGRLANSQRHLWWLGEKSQWDGVIPRVYYISSNLFTGFSMVDDISGAPTQSPAGFIVNTGIEGSAPGRTDFHYRDKTLTHVSQYINSAVTLLSRTFFTYAPDWPDLPPENQNRYITAGQWYTPKLAPEGNLEDSPASVFVSPNKRAWASAVIDGEIRVYSLEDPASDPPYTEMSQYHVINTGTTNNGVVSMAESVPDNKMIMVVSVNGGPLIAYSRPHDGPIDSGWTEEILPELPSGFSPVGQGSSTTIGGKFNWVGKAANGSGDSIVYLLTRDSSGSWNLRTIVNSGPEMEPVKPYISGASDEYKWVSYGNSVPPYNATIKLVTPSSVGPDINPFSQGRYIDSVMIPREELSPEMGLVVMGHDLDTQTVAFKHLSLEEIGMQDGSSISAYVGSDPVLAVFSGGVEVSSIL